ncbi:hypothetical protein DMB38_12890 [Streptomyces sp. WAC 06738]|nr:hypothetical protein DMB38_12890 [Streptomyces sp. WAC 06738]
MIGHVCPAARLDAQRVQGHRQGVSAQVKQATEGLGVVVVEADIDLVDLGVEEDRGVGLGEARGVQSAGEVGGGRCRAGLLVSGMRASCRGRGLEWA